MLIFVVVKKGFKNMEQIEQGTSAVAPYYLPLGNEVALFLAAYEERLPILLKGPTDAGRQDLSVHGPLLYRGDSSSPEREILSIR